MKVAGHSRVNLLMSKIFAYNYASVLVWLKEMSRGNS